MNDFEIIDVKANEDGSFNILVKQGDDHFIWNCVFNSYSHELVNNQDIQEVPITCERYDNGTGK